MKRMRQSRKINISNDGEIMIAKVKQRLPSLSLRDILNGMENLIYFMFCWYNSNILAGHPVLRGYWSQRNTPMLTNGETIEPQVNHGNASESKKALYPSSQLQPMVDGVELIEHKHGNASVSSSQPMVDGSTRLGTHYCNTSSLVTSVSNSREGSPDKTGSTMLFAKPPSAPKLVSPADGVSWFPSAPMRPAALSMAHLPLFAAWTDT
ncbi:hypothetical protein GQ457_04G029530 [Hibiscus cannabinus]